MKPFIVFCDDDKGLTTIAGMALEENGYEYKVFNSGDLLVDYVSRGGRIDILVLDLRMRGLSGLEVLEALKGHDFPVIIFTGSDPTTSIYKKATEYSKCIIEKPFGFQHLIGIIKNVWDSREFN
jgi:DNA-binding NtrC family response regulator